MKASKIFIKWIIISIVFQLAVYFYLDKYYFASGINFKAEDQKGVYVYKKKALKPNVIFSPNAKDIELSPDCSYTAYFDNGIVKVLDTGTGKSRKITFGEGVQCLAYKWVPGSNRMIIAEKIRSGNGRVIKFYSYDADNQFKEEVKEYNTQRSDAIPAGISQNQVSMAMSPLTNVMYVKVSYINGVSSIYRIDANETMTRVNTVTNRIGKIGVASRDDQLVYEDNISSMVRTNTSCRFISIKGNLHFGFLGTDDDDNIYVMNKTEKVNKIYYGKLAEPQNSWNVINLNNFYEAQNLKVMDDGKIYFIDKQNSKIVNVKNQNYCTYEGNFIGIYDGKIASMSNSKLVLKNIN